MSISNMNDIQQFFATREDFKKYIEDYRFLYRIEYDEDKFPCIAYSTTRYNPDGPDDMTWHQFGMTEVIFFYEMLKRNPELFAKVWVGEKK